MKKLFRQVAGVIFFSFVACLFLPLQAQSAIISSREICRTGIYNDGLQFQQFNAVEYADNFNPCILALHYSGSTWIKYILVLSDTTVGVNVVQKNFSRHSTSEDFPHDGNQPVTWTPDYVNNDRNQRCYYTPFANVDSANTNGVYPYQFKVPVIDFTSMDDLTDFVKKGDISDDIPVDTNTDNYSFDKSLGLVKNARWKHLESKDKYNQVLQDAMNHGTGTGDSGNAFYSDIYTRYAEFVQDKCSFATTSTTGIRIGGRYQLQYASRVGFTFAYNLPDLLEHTDFTKQYYKRFGSPKPYPVVNGTNFNANQNIQSLFLQAYKWNDSLPSVGNMKRSLIFKETKYWIDVRIIDTKTKAYGAWYAMDMNNNNAKEVVTENGDIDSDVSSEDDAGNYTKEEGEGDTFQDAEDNAHEVEHSTRYDQKWYDDIKDNTKKSAPAFKNLLAMVKGIPSMIKTLFSWLPSWVLELVSAFFAIIIVLALLRFVLGS